VDGWVGWATAASAGVTPFWWLKTTVGVAVVVEQVSPMLRLDGLQLFTQEEGSSLNVVRVVVVVVAEEVEVLIVEKNC